MAGSSRDQAAQARLWLWGLIPLALLWIVGAFVETKPVERVIGARVLTAVKSSAWVPATIAVQGRDVALGGEAYETVDRAATRDAVSDVAGVRRVVDHSQLPPTATPFKWSATKVSDGINLSGSVPKPADRTTIFTAAGTAAAKVTDSATYALGAPAGFADAAGQLATLLAKVSEGSVSIEGTNVSIEGVAKDKASADAVDAALTKLPSGFAVAEKKITVPVYTVTATKDAAAHNVTLTGTLPDKTSRDSILGAARRMFVGQDIVDRTDLQPGAPNGFVASVTTGLEQLSRLDGGTLKVAGGDVELTGTALYDRAIDQIKSALGSGKVGLKAKPPGEAVDQSTCQQRFNDLLSKGTVQFETGSAKIDKVSAGILDQLVGIALQCPSQSLEISGHTDAQGNDDFNMQLSKTRAQAVVDYLTAAGLDAGKLTAIGYGKTKPIASNDTDEGRAKNRRIEFLVK